MTDETRPPRQPMFNAPWQAVAVPAVLIAAYGAQVSFGTDAGVLNMGVSGPALEHGRFQTLITYMFVHAGVAHLGMNCLAAFAFGPPVARRLGPRPVGVILFFAFFLLCGALAALGYVVSHPASLDVAIGASGAISGLWGAASRLLIGRGRLAPIRDRMVLTQGAAFIFVNVLVGLLGGFGGFLIAWEAHVAGYIAGLLLIGLFARAADRP